MDLPDRINHAWIESLSNGDLADAELQLHGVFSELDAAERQARGKRYDLMRAPGPLLEAWNRWSMVNAATRERGLHPRSAMRKH